MEHQKPKISAFKMFEKIDAIVYNPKMNYRRKPVTRSS